jgi:hypothetical protein
MFPMRPIVEDLVELGSLGVLMSFIAVISLAVQSFGAG